eukprot:364858-Chlamydomonas_euryale.AAC.6
MAAVPCALRSVPFALRPWRLRPVLCALRPVLLRRLTAVWRPAQWSRCHSMPVRPGWGAAGWGAVGWGGVGRWGITARCGRAQHLERHALESSPCHRIKPMP